MKYEASARLRVVLPIVTFV